MLPRQYEAHRAEIEAILPPIHLPVPASAATLITSATGPEDVSGDALGFIHRYVPPAAGAELAGSTTLLLLHGTGGDEEDLIPLGRALLPGAGLLSPRGKVFERGAPRFFRRIAEGVFDQEDLARRTEELAQFVEAAAKTCDLELQGIVTVADSMAPPAQAEHLADLLRRAGAAVTVHWEPGGHAVTEGEVDAARQWLWQRVVERPQERGMPIAKEN